MPNRPSLRFLLTNDDGLEAPGLAALAAALPAGSTHTVVAPMVERSGCSHKVTTTRELRVERSGQGRYAVDAEPADCVRVALHDARDGYDWVLAGINNGANLGVDVYYSGTMAAIREAAFYGLPGVAVSHYRDRVLDKADWRRATRWVRRLLPDLLAEPLAAGEHWNVNLPSLAPGPADPRVVHCPLDIKPMPLRYSVQGSDYLYSGVYHQRSSHPGHDIATCFGGSIAVTRMRLA